jgi:hypothetical protein
MTNYKIIPTWNEGVWEETEFQTIEDFREFIVMKYHINLMNKQLNLTNKDSIVINLLNQKILMHIGKIKKINVEKELYIKIKVIHGI